MPYVPHEVRSGLCHNNADMSVRPLPRALEMPSEVGPGGIRAMPGAQASGMEWVLTVLYCSILMLVLSVG